MFANTYIHMYMCICSFKENKRKIRIPVGKNHKLIFKFTLTINEKLTLRLQNLFCVFFKVWKTYKELGGTGINKIKYERGINKNVVSHKDKITKSNMKEE